jgi:hypothetical protein
LLASMVALRVRMSKNALLFVTISRRLFLVT